MSCVKMVLSCCLACLSLVICTCHPCHFVVVAGSDTVAQPFLFLDCTTEIDAAAQSLDLDGPQQPWLEYSFWHGQEWVKIYIPGELQLWRQHEDVPTVPDNTYRVWKPVVPEHDGPQGNDDQRRQPGQWQQWTNHYEAWTIQDWQHQGYQWILTRQESFAINNASAEPLDTMQNTATSIQVEELGAAQRRQPPHDRSLMNLVSYSPPSSLIFPSGLQPLTMQRGAPLPAQHDDPVSPSSQRHRTDRANSRSPRRFGYFGRR